MIDYYTKKPTSRPTSVTTFNPTFDPTSSPIFVHTSSPTNFPPLCSGSGWSNPAGQHFSCEMNLTTNTGYYLSTFTYCPSDYNNYINGVVV
jgi:hypothetical protein